MRVGSGLGCSRGPHNSTGNWQLGYESSILWDTWPPHLLVRWRTLAEKAAGVSTGLRPSGTGTVHAVAGPWKAFNGLHEVMRLAVSPFRKIRVSWEAEEKGGREAS